MVGCSRSDFRQNGVMSKAKYQPSNQATKQHYRDGEIHASFNRVDIKLMAVPLMTNVRK